MNYHGDDGRDKGDGGLPSSGLFAVLPREILQTLAQRGMRRAYRCGETLRPHEHGSQVGLVLDGHVRVYLLARDGRVFTVVEKTRGELFELVGTEESGVELRTATVVEAGKQGCAAYLFDYDEFLRAIAASDAGALQLFELLLGQLREQRETIGELAFCDVRTRVARTLGRLAEEDGRHVVWETHQELAERLGTGREEVSRALADLRRRRLVSSPRRGQTIVLQPEKLLEDDILNS